MPFHGPRTAVVAMASAIALAITGCGSGKTAQCDNLIDTINEGNAIMGDVEKKHQELETQAKAIKDEKAMIPIMNNFAALLETSAKEMKGISQQIGQLELKDETLVGFQQGYSGNLQTLQALFEKRSQALLKMGTILDAFYTTPPAQVTSDQRKKWKTDLQKAEADLASDPGQTNQAINKIADDINNYCGRKASDAAEE